jgi:hypothetical protein
LLGCAPPPPPALVVALPSIELDKPAPPGPPPGPAPLDPVPPDPPPPPPAVAGNALEHFLHYFLVVVLTGGVLPVPPGTPAPGLRISTSTT